MIRHEVILRIKTNVSREVIDRTLHDVAVLFQEASGVERIRFGVNNAPAYRHAMLVIDFTSEEAQHRLRRNPNFARAVRMIHQIAESTVIGSYPVGSERL